MDVDSAPGAAMRRRQRRLRQFLRHERLSVAMALAEKLHHTSRGLRFARAGEEGREEHDALRRQRPLPPQPELFQLYEEEPGGSRPPCLGEPRGPQERILPHTMELLADVVPVVQVLDFPVVLGGGDRVLEVLRKLDVPSVEQVIAVPKISMERVPQRSVLPVPQTAEQLVEVPTHPWYVAVVLASKVYSRREIRRILQGLDPQGRGGGGARGGLQGSRAGQNSTAYLEQIDENPVPQGRGGGGARGGLRSSLPEQNSAAVVEQIVDIPARRGLPDFLPGQGPSSSSSRLRDDADEDFTGVFRTFPRSKKSAKLGSHLGSELLSESSPSTRRAYEDRDAPG